MNPGRMAPAGLLALVLVMGAAAPAPETFTATASVKSAAGATATAPVTIVVNRITPSAEAEKVVGAFKTGGAAALRKALAGAASTGTVQIGSGAATDTRLTLERTTEKGRLLTIVTDKPLLFAGAGLPGAKPKEGYDFAVIDIEVDANGRGSGTLAPAAKVKVTGGAVVVDDYGSEGIRLVGVQRK